MPSAMTSAIIMPPRPPMTAPMAMNRAVIAAIRMAVFIRLNICVLARELPQIDAFAAAEFKSLDQRRGRRPPSARALQLAQSECPLAAGDDERVVMHREQRAGRALSVRHLGAPQLDALAVELEMRAGEGIEGAHAALDRFGRLRP